MHPPELSLAAAIRDADSPNTDARHKAIRSLAAALLQDIGEPGPLWCAADRHRAGDQVIAALRTAVLAAATDPMLAGVAATGLGMLGCADVRAWTAAWWDGAESADAQSESEAEAEAEAEAEVGTAGFLRECAAISASYLGVAARGNDPEVLGAVEADLARGMDSDHPDLRYQAALGLVEVGGDAVESHLVGALVRETVEEARLGLVLAIAKLEAPGTATCDALARLLVGEDSLTGELTLEAALVLAGARRTEAGPRLVAALARRPERDSALEALAVLGRAAPGDAVRAVHRLARRFWTPAITKVRAAYALSRLVAPDSASGRNPGDVALRRLAWHPRAAVREAVADARAALRALGDP